LIYLPIHMYGKEWITWLLAFRFVLNRQ
jgi:hypothetical protein